MNLKIKDLQSSVVHDIGPQGAVLGREKARCDIALRGGSVSKRHARIFYDNGSWLIEDLNSSNGTFINNQRISGAVMLSHGAVFSLAQMAFEVISVEDGAPGVDTQTSIDPYDEPSIRPSMPEYSEPYVEQAAPPPAHHQQAAPAYQTAPPAASPADFGPAGTASQSGRHAAGGEASMPGGMEAPQKITVGYFMMAIPKAFAYFLAAVPLIIVNPLGFVRKGIQEQKFHAMRWPELAAYGITAFVIMQCVSQLAGFFAGLVNLQFFFGALIPGLPIAVVGGTIGGLICGLIWHPVTRWVIKFLKGQSDDRSRTNYAMMYFTTMILIAIPSFLGTVLASVPVPFVRLLGPLIMIVGSLILLFVQYSWLKYFGVHKVIPIILIVLMVLSVAGTGFGFVGGLIGEIRALGSGGGGAVAAADSAAVAEAAKKAEDFAKKWAGKDLTALSDDERKEYEEEAKAIAAMQAEAAQAAAAAAAKGDDEDKADEDEADEDKADEDKADEDKADEDKADEDKADEGLEIGDSPKEDKGDDAAGKAEPDEPDEPAAAGPVKASKEYRDFIKKYERVEKAIEENPAYLADKNLRNDYRNLLKKVFEAERDFRPKKKEDPWDRKIKMLQMKYEIFKRTRKDVNRMHKRMFGS